MQAEDFEWDEIKALENYAKHGVSFETARALFKDVFAVEELDDRERIGSRLWACRMAPCCSRPIPYVGLGKKSHQA
jgi:uncharacterized DUF497 family protein